MENLTDTEETKQDYGNEEQPSMPIDIRGHWRQIFLIICLVGIIDALNSVYLMAWKLEFQMASNLFLDRFRQNLDFGAFLFAREHLRVLFALRCFVFDVIFGVPAVIIRFVFIREPITKNPNGCAIAIIFTLGLIFSVFFGKGFLGLYGMGRVVGYSLVFFGWYRILMMRREY